MTPNSASRPGPHPTVVIFDLGGVLIDWNPRHLYRKLIDDREEMERFLETVTTREWHGLQDAGGDAAEATRRLQALHPGKEALIAAFYERFDEMCDHAFPDTAALVERLHASGVPLYLLSNAPALIDGFLRQRGHRRHPFLGHFRDCMVSGLVGHSKPDTAIYELMARTGGFRPADAVFVDDVLANVEGARKAGMAAIHHCSAEQTAIELRALGLPA